MYNGITIEVCCGSTEDAYGAFIAGADRVELTTDLFHGGLTPTIGSLIAVKQETTISVMAMVRPREGGFCYTKLEYLTAIKDAEQLIKHGADGLVFGFLTPEGKVDKARCKEFVQLAAGKQTVFSRAIDVVPDVFSALDTLMELNVTRVLTSGCEKTAAEGAQTIAKMNAYAKGRIEILPGGGVNPSNGKYILEQTNVNQLHMRRTKLAYDTSTMANAKITFGGALYPPEDRYTVVDAEALKLAIEEVTK